MARGGEILVDFQKEKGNDTKETKTQKQHGLRATMFCFVRVDVCKRFMRKLDY